MKARRTIILPLEPMLERYADARPTVVEPRRPASTDLPRLSHRPRVGTSAPTDHPLILPAAIGKASPDPDRFFETLLTMLPDLILVYDLVEREVVWCSPALTEIVGYTESEVIGRSGEVLEALFDEADRTRLLGELHALREMPDGTYAWLRLRARHRDGTSRCLSIRLTPFRRDAADDAIVTQCLAVVRDVTDIVAAEDQLAHDALHDSLTGLANRTLLIERLHAAVERCKRGGDVAVLFFDLDDFKSINDRWGHSAGDEVLRIVANRLQSVVRPSDAVGRLGGDEFVVVVEAPVDATAAAQAVAERFATALESPIAHNGGAMSVTASIGIASLGESGSAEDILNRADAAMYRAKQRRRTARVLTEARAAIVVSPTEDG